MTIKFEFPADRADIALAIGQALTAIATGKALVNSPADSQALVEHEHLPVGDANAQNPKDPAPSATATAGSGEASASADGASSGTPRVDEYGVAFNAEFCGNAEKPFYGSGKKQGQWKKRQGVDEGRYDAWYEAEKEKLSRGVMPEPDGFNAEAVFGKPEVGQDEDVPQDAGQLMKWVSEQQVAERITQQDVTSAYTALGLGFDAIMNPNEDIAANCAQLYTRLKAVADSE